MSYQYVYTPVFTGRHLKITTSCWGAIFHDNQHMLDNQLATTQDHLWPNISFSQKIWPRPQGVIQFQSCGFQFPGLTQKSWTVVSTLGSVRTEKGQEEQDTPSPHRKSPQFSFHLVPKACRIRSLDKFGEKSVRFAVWILQFHQETWEAEKGKSPVSIFVLYIHMYYCKYMNISEYVYT